MIVSHVTYMSCMFNYSLNSIHRQ